MDKQQVGHGPGMTAIAVGKRVNDHQPVMKPHGNLVGRVCVQSYPGDNIVAQFSQLNRHLPPRYADIFIAPTELTGPAPHMAEHPLMKTTNKGFVQDILLSASESPGFTLRNIILLPAIQLAA